MLVGLIKFAVYRNNRALHQENERMASLPIV